MNHHKLPATVQVGKSGITPALLAEIKKQFKTKKQIKIRLLKGCLENQSKQELFKAIELKTGAKVIHKVGFVIVLEKPSKTFK